MRGLVLLDLLVTLTVGAVVLAALTVFSITVRRALAAHAPSERLRAYYSLEGDLSGFHCATYPRTAGSLIICERPALSDLPYSTEHPSLFATFQ